MRTQTNAHLDTHTHTHRNFILSGVFFWGGLPHTRKYLFVTTYTWVYKHTRKRAHGPTDTSTHTYMRTDGISFLL